MQSRGRFFVPLSCVFHCCCNCTEHTLFGFRNFVRLVVDFNWCTRWLILHASMAIYTFPNTCSTRRWFRTAKIHIVYNYLLCSLHYPCQCFDSDYTGDCTDGEKTTVISGTTTSGCATKWVLPVCVTVGILVAIVILVGVLFLLRRRRRMRQRSRGLW